MLTKELVQLAQASMDKAYAPYSDFRVGAALLCGDGTVYTGCNIENASYGATCCAERTAFFQAVGEGHRDFAAIAICGGQNGILTNFCPPCGICRQVMAEFCDPDFQIHLTDGKEIRTHTPGELFPGSFTGESMNP
jgi:cytidine deaminase